MNDPTPPPDERAGGPDGGEEPQITGTLFLTTLLLVLILGFWVVMYLTLVGR